MFDIEIEYLSTFCSPKPGSLKWINENLCVFLSKHSIFLASIHQPFNNTTSHSSIHSKIIQRIFYKNYHLESFDVLFDISSESKCYLCACTNSNPTSIVVWHADSKSKEFIFKSPFYFSTDIKCNSISCCLRNSFKSTPMLYIAVCSHISSCLKVYALNLQANEFAHLSNVSFSAGSLPISMKVFSHDCENMKHILFCCVGLSHNDLDVFAILLDQNEDTLLAEELIQSKHVAKLSGYENWITCIDISCVLRKSDGIDAYYLITSSLDCSVKIWKFLVQKFERRTPDTHAEDANFLDKFFNRNLSFSWEIEELSLSLRISLESSFTAHKDWIYCVSWIKDDPMCSKFLSCSFDNTILIWKFDKIDKIWTISSRLGELCKENCFYGAYINKTNTFIIAYDIHGSFYLWNLRNNEWEPSCISFSGHFEAINDLDWHKEAAYLISVGVDKTCRIHSSARHEKRWREISRAQIHGYEINCISSISFDCYVSGADEKIIRVFKPTRSFIQHLNEVTKKDFCASVAPSVTVEKEALELSTNAVITNDGSDQGNLVCDITNLTESKLSSTTLWCEVNKLYAHGNEIFALAFNSLYNILASSAKCKVSETCHVIFWDCTSWQIITNVVDSHKQTITRMKFSPCQNYLLSVSRDRTWTLYTNFHTIPSTHFKSTQIPVKGHNRIIWDCAWTHDSRYFVTASRDKSVIIWGSHQPEESNSIQLLARKLFEDPCTCVDFFPSFLTNESTYFFAVGFEFGNIVICDFIVLSLSIHCVYEFKAEYCFTGFVKRLVFANVKKCDNTSQYELAVCSEDSTLKIFSICCQ